MAVEDQHTFAAIRFLFCFGVKDLGEPAISSVAIGLPVLSTCEARHLRKFNLSSIHGIRVL